MKRIFPMLFLILTSECFSQTEDRLLISNLSVFQGCWKGEAFGGTAEEIWSDPSSGTMIGMFRLSDSVKTVLYEFLVIEEGIDGVFMKFKHIKPGYVVLESEPITLQLVELDNYRFVFKSRNEESDPNKIIYEFRDSTNLLITVEGIEDGKPHSFNIQMRKEQKEL